MENIPVYKDSIHCWSKIALLFATLLTGIGLVAAWIAPANADTALERVTLQLRWFHQFQFAGYYAALEKGYYLDAGLDVVISERDMNQDTVDMVTSGQAEYGVTNSEILLHALQGKPIVVMAAIFQHSPLVLIAHEHTDIHTPHDLIGARVKMTRHSRDIELQAMLVNEGVSLDQLQLTDGEVGLEDYLDPNIDALSAYVSNEPFYLQHEGKEVQILWPRHYGVDFYGDCLFTSQDELASRPDRVQAFRKASLKGWEYAMKHPEEIVDLILERYNPQKSREHLLYEAETMQALILPELVRIGHVNPGRWWHIADMFSRLGYVASEDVTQDFMEGFIYDPAPPPYDSSALWRWIWLLAGGLAVAGMIVSVLLFFIRQQRRLIEARQQTEEALRFEMARLFSIFDSISENIYVCDPQTYEILYVNKHMQTVFGKELVGGICYRELEGMNRPCDFCTNDLIMDTKGAPHHWEHYNPILDKHFLVTDKLIKWPDGRNVKFELAIDITKRKRAEKRLLLVNKQLEKANAEKNLLFSIIAHDLKSPVSGLLVSTEMLANQMDIFSEKELRLLSTELHKNVKNTFALLEDLLQWARMSQGGLEYAPTPLRLTELVNMGLSTVRDAAEKKNIVLSYDIPQDIEVLADKPMINIVIRNVIFNAIKFTNPGGSISVTARKTGSVVEVCVMDDGIGMDEVTLSTIFNIDKNKRQMGTDGEKGTGLGLILCKEFVEKHGGEIWLESEPGQGTKVYFTLPAVS
ncbi:MAG: ABC transporter substrate-binding protein [Desulfonatronovibrio sp.]